MCEILAVKWPEPRPFSAVAPWARAMEHYGSGRFGWGVAWLDEATPFVGEREIRRMYDEIVTARFLTYLVEPIHMLCDERVGLVYEVVDTTTLDGRADQHHRVEVFEFREGKIASVRAFRQGSL